MKANETVRLLVNKASAPKNKKRRTSQYMDNQEQSEFLQIKG